MAKVQKSKTEKPKCECTEDDKWVTFCMKDSIVATLIPKEMWNCIIKKAAMDLKKMQEFEKEVERVTDL